MLKRVVEEKKLHPKMQVVTAMVHLDGYHDTSSSPVQVIILFTLFTLINVI